jgi:hypothetical protein
LRTKKLPADGTLAAGLPQGIRHVPATASRPYTTCYLYGEGTRGVFSIAEATGLTEVRTPERVLLCYTSSCMSWVTVKLVWAIVPKARAALPGAHWFWRLGCLLIGFARRGSPAPKNTLSTREARKLLRLLAQLCRHWHPPGRQLSGMRRRARRWSTTGRSPFEIPWARKPRIG